MKFKKWVKVVLIIIACVSLLVIASDCKDMGTFISMHIVALISFMISTALLIKYGN